MAVQVYPATLPVPLMDGYGEQPQFSKRSFEPEEGPAIESRRGTLRWSKDVWALYLTAEQLVTFEEFVRDDLRGAILPFLVQHPRREEQVKAKLTGTTPYSIAPLGVGYKVSIAVSVIG